MNLYQVALACPSLSLSQHIGPGQFETDAMEEEEQQHASLGILYEAMVQLTVEPGRFDSIARRLTEDLNMVLEGELLEFFKHPLNPCSQIMITWKRLLK